MIREYYELYYHKDPMRAEVLIRGEKTVETFENAVLSCDQNLLEQYRPFLRKHSVVDEIDFVLWAGGNAVGSVALLFHQSDTLSVSKESLAGMQSYLQYAFSLMPAVKALELKSILQDTYGLTTKEREVAELMIMGESNKGIASMLGVELATVKTHLVHIFQKMEVKSRSKAIALLVAE
ncbi:helix-turn-helix transcriptional regulator [Pseudomonas sp. DR48]|uniref:helix-turn-helix transcriptional regulator n=1 Tax=Pseudomonas sp. DR48 TaxID=2871095 RepID=UPI001C9A11FC|nr:helix-turn-helix transcriptional regulator [Pseudomonas sp. DR48]QZP31646.1 helix-turn-helix transcriptional regulator [Pseudomonas sp. DR48]